MGKSSIVRLLLVMAILSSMAGFLFAMPPYQGIREPEALKAMRLKGMDSPERGLIFQLKDIKGSDAKVTGSREYPVIMGYFTDLAAINTQAEFQGMLFNTGTNNKSVNNYYRDMSYNTMSCSGAVDNWRTSNNTVAYYSANYGFNTGTTGNTYEFIIKTLAHADSFVNFADSSYDQNHDGYLDVLWVVHAGKGAEEGATAIWSHSFYLSGWGSGATYYTTGDISPFTGNPVRINEYIIMPERTNYADGNGGTTEMIGCGVFCHEFGHALGLPDLYDTDNYDYGAGSGIGKFSLMAGGSWGGNGSTNARPVALDLWCRRFLGWASPTLVTANDVYTVNSIMTTATNSSYKLAFLGTDTTKQFWLVENRYELGMGPVSSVRWDSLLPSTSPGGLAIYHIDSTYTTTTYLNNNTMNNKYTSGGVARPYGVAVEETDMTTAGYRSELWNGTNDGDAADYWTSSTQASFDSSGTAYPVSYYNGATDSTGGAHAGVAVRQIPAGSSAMTCSLIVKPEGAPTGPAMALDHTYYDVNVPQNDSLDQTLVIGNTGGMDLDWNLTYLNTGIGSYDNADNGDAIGNGGTTFTTAILLTSTELASYYETYELYAVKALIILPITNVTVKVWQGGTTSPTTEIYSSDVTASTADGWNTYQLPSPITLQTGINYWVGYSVGHVNGTYPASTDNGPAIDGKGDWVEAGGWAELQTYALDYNWNLKAMLGKKLADWITIDPTSGTVAAAGNSNVTFSFNATGLSLGTYSDTVCLASNDLANNPKKIPVSMTVGASGVSGKPQAGNPAVFALQNAWPNPARGQVNFRYQLPRAAQVDIKVYNVLGQTVKSFDRGLQEPGHYSLKWSDANVAEGVYFVRLQAGNYRATRKFVVVQ
ncbi:MAG TPA: hypothetical protein DEO67_04425 [Candidatus Edwardsbacteria bacterium]|nr:hypothetical protein [Candidatus Edwardsbacteria bacterium]